VKCASMAWHALHSALSAPGREQQVVEDGGA